MILSKFFKNHLTIPQATKLFEEVKTQTHPDIADLKRPVGFHKAPVGTKDEMQALDLKYRALTTEPSIIEKTMSPYQLYASGSPLWTSELTAEEADAVLKHTVGTCTLTEDEFNDRYNKAITGELTKKPFTLNFWQ
jgi:hypothetical protein